ncbi:site-2 protease family protein [Hydromonas duriensis]|uniref:Zn-dependent protease n=1 Tax=Hydromonas duriensis TaxID=1527608 RepID=A0A4R6Y5L7_9BURK|nr:site-2 protease family protein [Hydromonas duriensis]TDR30757.1 Zn-dependent protease [Hydromonas duriensis]
MNIDMAELIRDLTIYIIPIIFAVTLHEAAHAYAARYFGDNTAHSMGRTSLNPMVHIDPIGTVVMPLAMFIFTNGNFFFGYAKPVPVITSRLRNPKADMAMVALAGPMANAVMALGWAVFALLAATFLPTQEFFSLVARAGVLSNLLMFAFNLFPLLPLDGGRILAGILPDSLARPFSAIEQYGTFIILFLVISGSGLIGQYWISPIMNIMAKIISALVFPLARILA